MPQAITTVVQGKQYLTPSITKPVIEHMLHAQETHEIKGDSSTLTGRQREVLQLIREGKGIKEIAALLNISVKTVQFHKNCLMQELNLHTTMALMRYAITEGLVTDRPEPSSSLTPN